MDWQQLEDDIWDILDDDGHNGIECRHQRPLDTTAQRIVGLIRSRTEHDFLEV